VRLAGLCGVPVCVRFVGRAVSAGMRLTNRAVSSLWSGVLYLDNSYTPRLILFWWNFARDPTCGFGGGRRVYVRKIALP